MPAAGEPKASFHDLDGGGVFEVQFNPSEVRRTARAGWKPSGRVARPALSYDRGEPGTLAMTLYFDTTRCPGDVALDWVEPLSSFLERSAKDGRAHGGLRPPHVRFVWASLVFEGVLSSLDVSYLMFRRDGTPVRAKVELQMMEHVDAPPAPKRPARLCEAPQARSVDDVALTTGSSREDLIAANPDADPYEPDAEHPWVVPGEESRP